jgi:SHS2 domain-containing protein
MTGYIEVPHTADVCLRVWGDDLVSLFEQSARGLHHLMQPRIGAGEISSRRIDIIGSDIETLLVDFLSTILYWIEVDKLVCIDYAFSIIDCRIYGEISCQPCLAIARHIKAVTYHNLAVRQISGELVTEIVFDV